MKRKAFFLIAILSLVMSSCVYSLFPLYTKDTLVYKKEILGEWSYEGEARFRLESYLESTPNKGILDLDNPEPRDSKVNQMAYKLTVYESHGSSNLDTLSYKAHLVEIDGELFLNQIPLKEYSKVDLYDNYLAVNTFTKVEVSENKLRLIPFDLEKLNRLFDSNLIRLRHENVNGAILITARPEELQKFIARYAKDESVFDESVSYQRSSK